MYPNTPCPDCPDCPTTVTPIPLPNLYGLCGDHYDLACVEYTGTNIPCLGITSGMTVAEILLIFQTASQACGCCVNLPVNCTVGPWSDYGVCECVETDGTVICQKTRTRDIITAPSNGGTACPPLTETLPCPIEDVCFTFGSYLCETGADEVQVTSAPTGIYNGKPSYELIPCLGVTQYVWFNSSTGNWYISGAIGTISQPFQVLDNNGLTTPISNNTDELWSAGASGYLISSQSTDCPDVKICFKITVTVSGNLHTYYFQNAAAYINSTGKPVYEFSFIAPDSNAYNFVIAYNGTSNLWEFTSYLNSGSGVIMSTLNTQNFYPLSSSMSWVSPLLSDPKLVLTSQDACVQPPDVDCSWDCSGYGPCNTRTCIQTQTCTQIPAQGNGAPCGPMPDLQQPCCDPSCQQPQSPTVEIVGANVEITFVAVPGSVGYTLTYTYSGGAPTSITSSLPSFSFPWVCGVLYTGTIVTNCGLLSSDPTPFSIQIPDCPAPIPCEGSTNSFVAGLFASPQKLLLKIDSTTAIINSALPFFNANPTMQIPYFLCNDLGSDGTYVGGVANLSLTDGSGLYKFAGIGKFKCTPIGLYNGTFDRSFASGLDFGIFGVSGTSPSFASVKAVKYNPDSNLLYVGGRFDTYRGVPCPHNLVCLHGTTGNLQPDTVFKLGTAGIQSGTGGYPSSTVCVTDIQFDTSGVSKKLVVAGRFTTVQPRGTAPVVSVSNIVRLELDGTVDTSFVISAVNGFAAGQASTDSGLSLAAYSYVKSIYVDSIGDIYAGGSFYQYKGVTANNIVKIKKNGSIASTSEFNPGTGFITPASKSEGWFNPLYSSTQDVPYRYTDFSVTPSASKIHIAIEKIVPHINGILVTGNFGHYNGAQINGLIKLNISGTRDNTFIGDTTTVMPTNYLSSGLANALLGTSRSGMTLKVLNDNRVLFGGFINNYLGSGSTKQAYYVLSSTGTVVSSTTGLTSVNPGLEAIYINDIISNFM